MGTLHFCSIIRVDEEVDVDVAVACMAEIDDGDVVLCGETLETLDQCRHGGDGNGDILVDLFGSDMAQCR